MDEERFIQLRRLHGRFKAGDRAAFFLLGAAIGAAAALLTAPASGERTRRRLVRKGEEVADYLIDAGRELVEKFVGL